MSGGGGGSPSGFRNRTQAGSSQTAGFGSDGMTDVVITAARRTPVGSFLGSFATTPAHELGRIAIEAELGDAGVAPDEVSEVILGQVLDRKGVVWGKGVSVRCDLCGASII